MQRLTHLTTLLIGCAVAGAASFTFIEAQPARAVDYVKCEAMNKIANRLNDELLWALRKAEDDAGGYVPKSEYPEQYQRLMDAMAAASAPYQVKLDRVEDDYKAAGCPAIGCEYAWCL